MRDLRPDQGQCRAGTPVAEAAERGHLTVLLHGHKLIGGCALTRIGPAGERWLLVKEADEYAGKTRDPSPEPAGIGEDGPRQRRTDPVKGNVRPAERPGVVEREAHHGPSRTAGIHHHDNHLRGEGRRDRGPLPGPRLEQ